MACRNEVKTKNVIRDIQRHTGKVTKFLIPYMPYRILPNYSTVCTIHSCWRVWNCSVLLLALVFIVSSCCSLSICFPSFLTVQCSLMIFVFFFFFFFFFVILFFVVLSSFLFLLFNVTGIVFLTGSSSSLISFLYFLFLSKKYSF